MRGGEASKSIDAYPSSDNCLTTVARPERAIIPFKSGVCSPAVIIRCFCRNVRPLTAELRPFVSNDRSFPAIDGGISAIDRRKSANDVTILR